MKKSMILLFAAVLAVSFGLAQKKDDYVAAGGFKKGDQSINLYYGLGGFNGALRNVASYGSLNISSSGFGPVGVVYEYCVEEKLGIGVELSYSEYRFSYDYPATVYTSTGIATTNYRADWKFTTIRIMPRINFHFLKYEDFDMYGFISAGYRSVKSKYYTNDPNGGLIYTYNSLIPFGVKPGLGIRYFFTKNVGLNAEFALGSPLLGGGLSFRF